MRRYTHATSAIWIRPRRANEQNCAGEYTARESRQCKPVELRRAGLPPSASRVTPLTLLVRKRQELI
jgi:hypothetical protein